MSDLPVVFQEKSSLGIKINSSCEITLERKLTSDDKAELLRFAKGQTQAYFSHQQQGDLYELKGGNYTLVVDSSGDQERIHLRTTNGNFAPLSLFGGLLGTFMTFIVLSSSLGINFRTILASISAFAISFLISWYWNRSGRGTVDKQERDIIEMIVKLRELTEAPAPLSSQP